ncbi:MAG TPA: hypothetical protein VKX17_02850 [Planctomycetota bacterium]|nr:hypothetical protein [Planctomycetota bacterium]
MTRAFFYLTPFLFAALNLFAAADFIWIEGESAKSNTVTRHPWWYDKVKTEQLSGGDYISNWGDKPGEAIYEFTADADRNDTFYVRANPVGTKLSYKLDAGDWTLIDFAGNQDNQINIAADDKIDLRFLAWAKVGAVKLSKGAHTIAFKFHSDNNNHGMLDCFVFTSIPFTPNGATKPGAKTAAAKVAAAEGRWAFTPAKDEFSPDALFDLRGLNEKIAGESGYVTRSKDGNDFVLGNGQPVRFWAVNDGAEEHKNLDLALHARFLAKRGINMVRAHTNVTPSKELMSIDERERDNLWRLVAAMKKEGIYTTFSPYWAVSSRVKPSMGVLDSGKGKEMGKLFFDKKLQEAYRAWLKAVLTEKNPYTGIPLAQDPALAIVQLQNEDSLLFWTSQGIEGAGAAELRKQFGEFLKKKYGSLDKAKEALGNPVPADNFASGEAGLVIVWELTQRGGGSGSRRADTLEFFTTLMRDFNTMAADYIHKDLGCKALINAGNWRTADNVLLLDAERYAYTANDVMGVNRYYTGQHIGKNNGWAIANGDKFTDESVLLRPRELPVNLKQVEGFPIIISESTWVPPLGYQSEGPFTVAAYSSLSGVDIYYWFATGEEDWRNPGSANGFMPSEGKWVCATPMLMGQWPATALLFRKNYVKQGEPAVREQRALADIWQRKTPIIAEDAGYDPNRDKDNLSKESNIKDGVNPLAFLVGPVVTTYGGDPSKSKVADLKPYIDDAAKTVKSDTNELEWNYGIGLCTLNAPKAQGVTGFLNKTGTFKLADVEIRSKNDYATILVVSLDALPLKQSAKILIQIGTTERPTNWETKPAKIGKQDGEEIVNFGKAPWQIVETDASVAIASGNLKTAHVLDANGMKVRDIPLEDVNGRKEIKLPKDALYVVIE